MNSNVKTRPEEEIRRTAERVSEQSNQAFSQLAATTSGTAETIKDCCTQAVKGAQDYHARLLEFTQTNTKHSFEAAQKLLGAKSPTEFFEISADYTRRQLETVAEQARQLTELAQKVTFASVEPLKANFENAFKRAA